jgi:diaminohydroxyphosphoribosylaminopyrimidine deaminase/5-amino-6-(5-phosphoribosylamino)uracil reductase
MNDDAHWMQLALGEAARGIGLTSPNPCVGAAIVRDGQLLATGWHRKAGEPHAEINALRAALDKHGAAAVRGATAYITLEPCSTSGRTPPCTDALISAGLARVVWGADDPNPRHAGRAAAMLQDAGMVVSTGVLREACTDLLAPFAKFITTGLPWVVAKAGLSLDGRISRPPGEGQWLTSEASRADAMQLRVRADAILVGAATVRVDDPALTLRGPGIPPEKPQPLRVVLTRSGHLPATARIFTDEFRDRTIVCQDQPLQNVLRDLAAKGVVTVLIEGGSHLHAHAFSAGLVDEAWLYYAPLLCGTGQPLISPDDFGPSSVRLDIRDVTPIGTDFRVRLRRRGAC